MLPPKDNCAAILLGIALACLPLEGSKTFAQRFTFDSAACKDGGDGKFYGAAGRLVLAIPADELTHIGSLPQGRRAELPRAPDPSEPEGCPDNPFQGLTFAFGYQHRVIRGDTRNPPDLQGGVPRQLRLIAAEPSFWGLQPSREKRFDDVCREYGIREEAGGDIEVCYVKPALDLASRQQWAAYLKADTKKYMAPFDRPFVARCGGALLGNAEEKHRECDVDYKLFESLNISYEFSTREVSFDQIVNFDRKIRERLLSFEVRDFSWAE